MGGRSLGDDDVPWRRPSWLEAAQARSNRDVPMDDITPQMEATTIVLVKEDLSIRFCLDRNYVLIGFSNGTTVNTPFNK